MRDEIFGRALATGCLPIQLVNQGERGMAKEIVCAFGTDIDSVAGWIGSYGGAIRRPIFSGASSLARSASSDSCAYSRNTI